MAQQPAPWGRHLLGHSHFQLGFDCVTLVQSKDAQTFAILLFKLLYYVLTVREVFKWGLPIHAPNKVLHT